MYQIIADIATAFILIVAVVTFIWQIISRKQEKKYTNSSFALKSALVSFEEAVKLLSDGNNDRLTWITAARILRRAENISTKVTEDIHLDVLEVQKDLYRRIFGEILGLNNLDKKAAFFYGSKNLNADDDEAAKESTRGVNTSCGERGVLKNIPESVLWVLWEFAQFPTSYEDPIKEGFPNDIIENSSVRFMWPGLHDYLAHTRKYKSVIGELLPNK